LTLAYSRLVLPPILRRHMDFHVYHDLAHGDHDVDPQLQQHNRRMTCACATGHRVIVDSDKIIRYNSWLRRLLKV
jgi:hypothetical protein